MSQFHLVCNYKQCRKTLLQSAYVTTCSHVFCNEHGLNIITDSNLTCPVCNCHFQTNQDIIRVHMNPDETTKTVMMAGLSPEIIMEVATRALTFWGYQMNEENLYLEAGLKTAQENIDVLGAYCENIHSKYRAEINVLERKIDSLNEELEGNKKRCQELIQQLQDKTKVVNKLQISAMKKNPYGGTSKPTTPPQGRTPRSANNNQYKPFSTFNFHQASQPETVSNFQMIPNEGKSKAFVNFQNQAVLPEKYPPMHPFARGDQFGYEQNQDFNFQPNLNFK